MKKFILNRLASPIKLIGGIAIGALGWFLFASGLPTIIAIAMILVAGSGVWGGVSFLSEESDSWPFASSISHSAQPREKYLKSSGAFGRATSWSWMPNKDFARMIKFHIQNRSLLSNNESLDDTVHALHNLSTLGDYNSTAWAENLSMVNELISNSKMGEDSRMDHKARMAAEKLSVLFNEEAGVIASSLGEEQYDDLDGLVEAIATKTEAVREVRALQDKAAQEIRDAVMESTGVPTAAALQDRVYG